MPRIVPSTTDIRMNKTDKAAGLKELNSSQE